MPLVLAVLLAAGVTAFGWTIVQDRRALERDATEAEARIEELKTEMATDARLLGRQEQEVKQEREIAEDCVAAAQAGVAFLHEVVRSLGFLARFEESASRESQVEVNRLIREANQATRLCTRGLR